MSISNKTNQGQVADDFAFIRQRQLAITASNTVLANVRDAIEQGAQWWPSEVITDGADHVVFGPMLHNSERKEGAEHALSCSERGLL